MEVRAENALHAKQDNYDIAVIGAGPAGATFARLIGSKYKVIVIDKKTDESGFQKPCGGLLSLDAQKALACFNLSIPKEILADPQIFSVKTLDLDFKITRYYQRFYINIDRLKFDLWLSSMYPPHVEKFCGSCISVCKNNGRFDILCRGTDGNERKITATYIIGADGAGSLVRRTFYPRKRTRKYIAIQQWFAENHKNPFYSCIFETEKSSRCSWTISKDNYFIFGGAFKLKNCRQSFERQKEKLVKLGFDFEKPLKTEACMLFCPTSPFDFCCGNKGVFLLGEAAGFISPSSFEGISWAINSARILSDVFNGKRCNLNLRYKRKTLGIKFKLTLKMLKCLFIYFPPLRKIILKSGLGSISMYSNETKKDTD